jgi:uncharacterized membrane protein
VRVMSSVTAEELKRDVRAHQYHSTVNRVHHDQATRGERLADQIATGIGSWRFLIVQTILVLLWVGINLTGFVLRWDPYPFILLNLMFSVQAAYTGPVLLLAGNRQSQKYRLTLELAAREAQRADRQDRQILEDIKRNTEITLKVLPTWSSRPRASRPRRDRPPPSGWPSPRPRSRPGPGSAPGARRSPARAGRPCAAARP